MGLFFTQLVFSPGKKQIKNSTYLSSRVLGEAVKRKNKYCSVNCH